jgi:hypothetical protein
LFWIPIQDIFNQANNKSHYPASTELHDYTMEINEYILNIGSKQKSNQAGEQSGQA